MDLTPAAQAVASQLVQQLQREPKPLDGVDLRALPGAQRLSVHELRDVFVYAQAELRRSARLMDATPDGQVGRDLAAGGKTIRSKHLELTGSSFPYGRNKLTELVGFVLDKRANPSASARTLKSLREEVAKLGKTRSRNPVPFVFRDGDDAPVRSIADLAWSLDGLGEPRAAIHMYEAALSHEQHQDDLVLNNRLAVAFKHDRQLGRALEQLEHTLAKDPRYPPALYNKACCLAVTDGEPRALFASLRGAIDACPTEADKAKFRRMALLDPDFDGCARGDAEIFRIAAGQSFGAAYRAVSFPDTAPRLTQLDASGWFGLSAELVALAQSPATSERAQELRDNLERLLSERRLELVDGDWRGALAALDKELTTSKAERGARPCSIQELIERAATGKLDRDDRTVLDPPTLSRLRVELVALAAGDGTADRAIAAMRGIRDGFDSGALALTGQDNAVRSIDTLERYVAGALELNGRLI